MKEHAIYISVWDDNYAISSFCLFDRETKTVSDIQVVDVSNDDLEICHEEYVLLENNEKIYEFNIE